MPNHETLLFSHWPWLDAYSPRRARTRLQTPPTLAPFNEAWDEMMQACMAFAPAQEGHAARVALGMGVGKWGAWHGGW